MATPRPPFSWLGQHTDWVSLTVLAVTAVFFRFWHLIPFNHQLVLPPGLYTGEAISGLAAGNVVSHGWWPGMTAVNYYAPLWVVLQAKFVWLLGHTILALRLWPAIFGVLAVLVTYLWARDWFGRRIGWLAAFIVAITPWSVTLSRNALPTAIIPFLTVTTLWLGTRAYRRGGMWYWLGLAAVLVADLLSGPLGWLIVATVVVVGGLALLRRRDAFKLGRDRLPALVIGLVGLAVAGYVVVLSLGALKHLPSATGLTAKLASLADGTGRTLAMFNLHGDDNFRHNLSGEPLLNAFVGLMFVAGIIVAASRTHLRVYRLILILLAVLLLPAAFSTIGAPNAAHAAAALPIVAALAAIGISYMLELWYSTFPINSAARTTGQVAIIILLLLSLFHGYTQYFRAWAGSAETYGAYNEAAVASANFMMTTPAKGERVFVATVDELPVAAYLVNGKPPYLGITPAQLVALPTAGPHQFIVTAGARNDAVKNLGLKFPGGVLQPHYSGFNQAELYYVYEIGQ
jgi:4-amino-4-deoxy-L-arabinose transferase-like glycosyltransferase